MVSSSHTHTPPHTHWDTLIQPDVTVYPPFSSFLTIPKWLEVEHSDLLSLSPSTWKELAE